MFCPSCGAENAYGLRYCKRCGENLTPPQQASAPLQGSSLRKLAGMFWAVAVFGLVSLMALFGSAIPLTIFGADRRTLMPLFLFGTMSIVMIAGMLIRQLSRLITIIESGDRPPQSERPPQQVRPPVDQNYPQLASPPKSVSSVTENTTRNFDHSVYNEPRARE
jgi:hypothetical protein